jgi:hypothetical protein
MKNTVRASLLRDPFPYEDGWGWLYRTMERVAPAGGSLRLGLCRFFFPSRMERWGGGRVFRFLGVHLFGAVIPTGGIVVRRVTGARMAPYTLSSTTVGAARAFYYRTCVFEALHLPFFLALVVLAGIRAVEGRWDLALENTLLNLAVNLFPMMHHRHTRTRIVGLLVRKGRPGLK